MTNQLLTRASLQQISLSLSLEHGLLTHPSQLTNAQREREISDFRQDLIDFHGDTLPMNLHNHFAPYSVYIHDAHDSQLKLLHRALSKALSNIVGRWFSDTAANFPARMPIEPHEEQVLRWIDGPGKTIVPPYQSRAGVWRPDYLIERKSDDTDAVERIRICEINARFPFNGVWLVLGHQKASERLGLGKGDFEQQLDTESVLSSLLKFFDQTKPLHILKEQWPGVDVHCFARYYQQKTGQKATFVKTSELQLRDDSASPTSKSLYWVSQVSNGKSGADGAVDDGSNTTTAEERIYQVSIELFQQELATLSVPLLQHISTICVNDMRTIFLVHDKRMLAILLEEADNLQATGVLTQQESMALKDGLAPSIRPGSQRLRDLLERSRRQPTLKDQYILKGTRSGFGVDHIVGRDLMPDEWIEHLSQLCQAALPPSQQKHTIQEFVQYRPYDILRLHDTSVDKFALVMSYYAINGQFAAYGPCRLGNEDLAVFLNEKKQGIAMSVVKVVDGSSVMV